MISVLEYYIRRTYFIEIIFDFVHIKKNLFSKTVPYFLWLRLKLSYNISKNLLRGFIMEQKHIEFHMPHYEIPQPSPRYYLPLETFGEPLSLPTFCLSRFRMTPFEKVLS